MITRLRWTLLGLAMQLQVCSVGCTREVPVIHPSPPCQLPALAPFPDLPTVRACLDPGSPLESTVCMAAADATAIYTWVGDATRRLTKAEACLQDR